MREDCKIDLRHAASSTDVRRACAGLVGWLFVVVAALAGCGSTVPAGATKKSVAGESCTKTDDCAGDLRCVGAVCQVSDSGGNDIDASDDAAFDFDGAQVTDAVTAGGDASDATASEPDATADADAGVLTDAKPDATLDVTADSHDTTWFTLDTVTSVDVPDVSVQPDVAPDVPVPDVDGFAKPPLPGFSRVPRRRPHFRRAARAVAFCAARSSASRSRYEFASILTTSAQCVSRSTSVTTHAAFGKMSPHS